MKKVQTAIEQLLRWCFFMLVVRPVILVLLGLHVRGRQHLPQQGPAIIAANHNSHLDTLVLMTLLPQRLLSQVRPAAAVDYFLRNKPMAWFATRIMGILPIARKRGETSADPLAGASAALRQQQILIFFPEGSRGEPERMTAFRSGIAKLAAQHPNVPVFPVYMHGLGKALPKGEALLVPFFLDVFIDAPLYGRDHPDFLAQLQQRIQTLAAQHPANQLL